MTVVMTTRGRWRRSRTTWTVSPFGKARKVRAVAMLVAGSGVRHAAEDGAFCWPLALQDRRGQGGRKVLHVLSCTCQAAPPIAEKMCMACACRRDVWCLACVYVCMRQFTGVQYVGVYMSAALLDKPA